MNSSPHHLHTAHLASARTAPRGERREFPTDQRLVRSLARIAREGLGSLPRASRLCRRSLAYGPTAPTTPYANSRRLPPVTSGARGPGDRGGSGTRLGRWRHVGDAPRPPQLTRPPFPRLFS